MHEKTLKFILKYTSYIKATFTHTWIFLKLEYHTFVLKNILVHMKMEKKQTKKKQGACQGKRNSYITNTILTF